jgi:hypothetical protein
MTKYEYKREYIPREYDSDSQTGTDRRINRLNELGEEGWLLCDIEPPYHYFVREISEEEDIYEP